jgi:hypothetical protein
VVGSDYPTFIMSSSLELQLGMIRIKLELLWMICNLTLRWLSPNSPLCSSSAQDWRDRLGSLAQEEIVKNSPWNHHIAHKGRSSGPPFLRVPSVFSSQVKSTTCRVSIFTQGSR